MCTVLLRFAPGAAWPVLLAAVRDEFVDRAWDPPAAHWPLQPSIQGGRDRLGGGTWLAVDRSRGAVAALLNGVRRPAPDDGSPRPTRGTLVLAALADTAEQSDQVVPGIPDDATLTRYDGFHLLRADPYRVEVWSWNGTELAYRPVAPGDHIVVNLGVDRHDDPLVPHFRPLLQAVPQPPMVGHTEAAWDGWVDLLRGDGLDPTDPRALIVAHKFAGGVYGSTSASLVALGRSGQTRYDFTGTPAAPAWYQVSS